MAHGVFGIAVDVLRPTQITVRYREVATEWRMARSKRDAGQLLCSLVAMLTGFIVGWILLNGLLSAHGFNEDAALSKIQQDLGELIALYDEEAHEHSISVDPRAVPDAIRNSREQMLASVAASDGVDQMGHPA